MVSNENDGDETANKRSQSKKKGPKPQHTLRQFMAKALNQTTRERIFFNRLAFDLKIAAARVGYHLHLYEPDVDRDGFDIIVEDGETTRYLQLKAVLASTDSNDWDIRVDLLRPRPDAVEFYSKSPVESGRGGGVILIEIDDEDENGDVTYSYTDFDILAAISQSYLVEKKVTLAGKELVNHNYRDSALGRITEIWESKLDSNIETETDDETDIEIKTDKRLNRKIELKLRHFVRLKDANALLEVIGLRSSGYFNVSPLRDAYEVCQIGFGGVLPEPFILDETMAAAFHHLKRLTELQKPIGNDDNEVSRFFIPNIDFPDDIAS